MTSHRRRPPARLHRRRRREYRRRVRAGARGRRQGREADPPARTVRRPLFLPHPGRGPFRPRPARRPSIRRCRRCRSSPPSSRSTSRPASSRPTGHHHYNSLAMIDDKGAVMGVYRKSHIPDGPGYSEKFYFRPGNTGFKIFPTPLRHARRRRLLGPMVSGNGAGADARWAPRSCSSRPRSAPSRTIPISTPAGCGAGR